MRPNRSIERAGEWLKGLFEGVRGVFDDVARDSNLWYDEFEGTATGSDSAVQNLRKKLGIVVVPGDPHPPGEGGLPSDPVEAATDSGETVAGIPEIDPMEDTIKREDRLFRAMRDFKWNFGPSYGSKFEYFPERTENEVETQEAIPAISADQVETIRHHFAEETRIISDNFDEDIVDLEQEAG